MSRKNHHKLLVTVTYQFEWGKEFISNTIPCGTDDEARSNRDFIVKAANTRPTLKKLLEILDHSN